MRSARVAILFKYETFRVLLIGVNILHVCVSRRSFLHLDCMVLLSLGAEDGDSLMGKMKKCWKNRQAL